MGLPFLFLAAYILTNIIEFIPFTFLINRTTKEKGITLIIINSLTLPALWLVLPLFYDYYPFSFLVAEFLIVIVEAFLIKLLLAQSLLKSFEVSLIMNSLSALVGIVIM